MALFARCQQGGCFRHDGQPISSAHHRGGVGHVDGCFEFSAEELQRPVALALARASRAGSSFFHRCWPVQRQLLPLIPLLPRPRQWPALAAKHWCCAHSRCPSQHRLDASGNHPTALLIRDQRVLLVDRCCAARDGQQPVARLVDPAALVNADAGSWRIARCIRSRQWATDPLRFQPQASPKASRAGVLHGLKAP